MAKYIESKRDTELFVSGSLEDPSRVELIDGFMVDRMGKNAEHSYATKESLKALNNRLPAGWTWRQEQPVRIPDFDEPEPDVAIVRGPDADYRHRIPTADDVALRHHQKRRPQMHPEGPIGDPLPESTGDQRGAAEPELGGAAGGRELPGEQQERHERGPRGEAAAGSGEDARQR